MSITEILLLIAFIISTVGWILTIQLRKSILLYLADACEERAKAYEESIKRNNKASNSSLYEQDNLIKQGKAQGLRDAKKYILYELEDYS